MDGGPTLEGSLDALVSGKRASPRHAVRIAAVVKAARGEFEAQLMDLSLDGALVRIPIEELGGVPGEPLGPAEQFGPHMGYSHVKHRKSLKSENLQNKNSSNYRNHLRCITVSRILPFGLTF